MRLLVLLIAHASSYLGGKNCNNAGLIGNAVSRHDFSISKAGDVVPSGISVNTSDLNAIEYKSVYDDKDKYIKRLEMDNERLKSKLCDQQKMIQHFKTDIKLIEQTSRACMIFELYQRLRANMSNDLEERELLQDGKKLETFLEEMRKGKSFSGDKNVHWMMKFEISSEAQALKKFRNEYSHQTVDDIIILRQWRAELLRDSSPKNREINSASISILNKVIVHLSAPGSKPLRSKYQMEHKAKLNSSCCNGKGKVWYPKEAKVAKKLSKKELKIKARAFKKKKK